MGVDGTLPQSRLARPGDKLHHTIAASAGAIVILPSTADKGRSTEEVRCWTPDVRVLMRAMDGPGTIAHTERQIAEARLAGMREATRHAIDVLMPELGRLRRSGAAMSKEAMALAVLVENPGWTNDQIAETIGAHPKSLSRMDRFKAARRQITSEGKRHLRPAHYDARTKSFEASRDDTLPSENL